MRLTILIPVYNTQIHHLIEAVESVIRQDSNNFSHRTLIIDDASSYTQTISGLLYVAERYGSLVEIVSLKENKGTSAALNYGHSRVVTDYVAIMGSDDISHPERFKKQIAYLEKNPDVDVLGTNLFGFYNHDIFRTPIFTTQHKEIPAGLDNSKNWLVNHGTVIYKQKAVMEVGGYNENVKRGQDVELWGRMKAKGYKFRNLTETLYAWRRFKK